MKVLLAFIIACVVLVFINRPAQAATITLEVPSTVVNRILEAAAGFGFKCNTDNHENVHCVLLQEKSNVS